MIYFGTMSFLREADAIAHDPYSVYPNAIGHGLSYGEIGDFNRFQAWMRVSIRKFSRIPGGHRGHFGDETGVAEIRSVPDSIDSDRQLLQIVVTPGGLVETTYTLTGEGLVRQTRLPGEATPIIETIRGKGASKLFSALQQNLRP